MNVARKAASTVGRKLSNSFTPVASRWCTGATSGAVEGSTVGVVGSRAGGGRNQRAAGGVFSTFGKTTEISGAARALSSLAPALSGSDDTGSHASLDALLAKITPSGDSESSSHSTADDKTANEWEGMILKLRKMAQATPEAKSVLSHDTPDDFADSLASKDAPQTTASPYVMRQLELESQAVEDAVTRYQTMKDSAVGRGASTSLRPEQHVLMRWYRPLVRAIRDEQSRVIDRVTGMDRRVYGPYLLLLDAEKMAVIVLHEVLGNSLHTEMGATFSRMASHVGSAVLAEINLQRLTNMNVRVGSSTSVSRVNSIAKKALVNSEWSTATAVKVGAVLIDLLIRNAHVETENPKVEFVSSVFRRGNDGRIKWHLSGPQPDTPMTSAGKKEEQAAKEEEANRSGARGGDDGDYKNYPVGAETASGLSSISEVDKDFEEAGEAAELALTSGRGEDKDSDEEELEIGDDASALGLEEGSEATKLTELTLDPNIEESLAEFALESKEDEKSPLGGKKRGPKKLLMADVDVITDDTDLSDMFPWREVGDGRRLYTVPAFIHFFTFKTEGKDRKRLGMIRAHPEVVRMITQGHQLREALNPQHLPMVCPPRPWINPESGGYLKVRSQVMRTKGSKLQQQYLRQGNLQLVYESLDSLGQTPWKVNKKIFDVATELWEAGGGIADLPSREDIPSPSAPDLENLTEEEKPKAMAQWRRQMFQTRRDNANAHSLRCDAVYKLRVAEQFQDDLFFFPHNVDFRGRAYPIPPHLNHLGADLNRGLLLFGRKKPLGPKGLSWMKVHLANLCGADKMSFEDRQKWCDDRLADVRASAADPINTKWWLNADDPWQCLATCFELTAALDHPEGAENYESGLPVHQDGSCNGLQHYAALGRDEYGGKGVNLLPSETPQDVYMGVREIVERRVREDAAAGNDLAGKLADNILRKTVKQTVMTSVYGVTFVGAKAQIQGRLKEQDFLDDEELYPASQYLARLTMEALSEMFSGARGIMEWLGDCAKVISGKGECVSWVTPMGLPIVQPYRRSSVHTVRTLMQHLRLTENDESAPVSKARQRSAFPPNYIHSLDSTHMLMTALACRDEGLTFAAVHDSYWTHASDVDRMSAILRDQFIALHSEPLLENLLEGFRRMHPDVSHQFGEIPERGHLDLTRVRSSEFFFQ